MLDHLEQALSPTPEASTPDTDGRPDWVTGYLWSSVGMVKAGWLTKDGWGVWRATPDGSEALLKYPERRPLSWGPPSAAAMGTVVDIVLDGVAVEPATVSP